MKEEKRWIYLLEYVLLYANFLCVSEDPKSIIGNEVNEASIGEPDIYIGGKV